MKLKNLFLAVVALSLAACAFDKDKGMTDGDEIKRRELLKQSYQKVEGTYSGTIKTVNGLEEIQLVLTVLDEEAGDNSHKLPVMNPLLAAYYKKINPVGPGYEFTTRLYPDRNNEIVMVNKGTKLTRDDIHTINAKIENGTIVGKASSTGGFIGNIELSLTSRQTGGNGSTEENEYYDNLRRQYQAIQGTYEGQIVSKVEANKKINVTLELQVLEKEQENSKITVPYLKGTLHDIADTYRFSDWTMTVSYNTDTTPFSLTLAGTPVNSSNSKATVSMRGTLEGDTFTGNFTRDPIPFPGAFVLKKK